MNKKLVVILGPTAAGKTELAIELAQKFPGKIVSADSRQIYQGLDIGTAKPTPEEMKIVKHYLINIKKPDQAYTLWQYKKNAIAKINKIITEGELPFLVGGTGLYIKAVVDNLKIPKVKPDLQLRKQLELKIQKKGLDSVYQELIKIDPEAAYIVDQNNPRRVVRALEIALKTEKPFSQQRTKGRTLFNVLQIGLLPNRKMIEKRANKMIKAGLVKEVENLIKRYDKNLPAFDAIGYREIIDYLSKKYLLSEAVEKIKKNTWRYAQRQMTWFKKDRRINWVKNSNEAKTLIKRFI